MKDGMENKNYEGLGKSLEDLLKDITDLHDIVIMSQSGIGIIQKMPDVAKFLMEIDGENEKKLKSFENAKRMAKTATIEVENNFPFLYSQSTLMQYSYLEGFIKRLITTFISNNDITEIKEFSNIKISISEYLSLDDNEKYDYIFQQYEKSVAIGIQYGITRFETLLKPIGLSGKVDEETTKSIFELSQIRNNILHRGAIADRFLVKNCPWLNYKINDKVKVNKESYEKFFKAILDYLSVIAIRIGEKRGKDVDQLTKLKPKL